MLRRSQPISRSDVIAAEELLDGHDLLACRLHSQDRQTAVAGSHNELLAVAQDDVPRAMFERVAGQVTERGRCLSIEPSPKDGRGDAPSCRAHLIDHQAQWFLARAVPEGVGPGPWLEGPHLIVNLLGGPGPVDRAVLLPQSQALVAWLASCGRPIRDTRSHAASMAIASRTGSTPS